MANRAIPCTHLTALTILIVIFVPNLQIHARLIDPHRFSFVIGSDWGNFDQMKSVGGTTVRDNLTGSAITISNSVYKDRIASGPGFSMQILYSPKSRLSAGISATYIRPDNFAYNRILHFEDDYYNRPISEKHLLEADLFTLGTVLRYQIPLERLKLNLSAGAVWLFASARLMHSNLMNMPLPPYIPEDETTHFRADGIGYLFSIGAAVQLARLSATPTAGYRFLKTGDVKDANDYHWDGMHLDFSGPFVGINFEIRP